MTWKDIYFEVPVFPRGQGRPRIGNRRAFKDRKDVLNEMKIREAFDRKYPDWKPVGEPVSVYIRASYEAPKSWTKKNKTILWIREHIWKTSKPDIDNICKAVFDAMNGAVWKDDAQVIRLSAAKFYHISEGPQLSVHIINEEQADGLDEKPLRELLQMKEAIAREEEEDADA